MTINHLTATMLINNTHICNSLARAAPAGPLLIATSVWVWEREFTGYGNTNGMVILSCGAGVKGDLSLKRKPVQPESWRERIIR